MLAFPSQPQGAGRGQGMGEVWSVGELTRRIGALVGSLGRVAVEGEVSRVTRATSGHVYFDLKDLDAKLACRLWKSQVARALKGELREGDKVIAHGKLDVYPPQGAYSLIVDRIEPAGLGASLVQLEALKAELRARGWFDRKRPLPALPRVIGVVTSRDGAALQDFLRTRSQRWPLYPLRLAHAPVQGPGAAAEIARAIQRLDASGVDVIVVCRGGGSLEDLWAFNELPVAEAIFGASVAVVSGVGHETDVTLADFVADVRAHTPTDAAQRTIPDRAALLEALARAAGHLSQAIDGVLGARAQRLALAARARVLRDPGWIHLDRAEALARLLHSLRLALARAGQEAKLRAGELHRRLERHSPRLSLESSAARLELFAGKIEALSPLAILARGYSITTRARGGGALRDPAHLSPGEELETRLARGRLRSRLLAAEPLPPRDAHGGGTPGAG